MIFSGVLNFLIIYLSLSSYIILLFKVITKCNIMFLVGG